MAKQKQQQPKPGPAAADAAPPPREFKTAHSPWFTYASMVTLFTLCPPFVILL